MNFERRELLAVVATAGGATLAGCTGNCGPEIPFFGSGMPNDGELAVGPAGSIPQDATVVAFSDLPSAERSLVETAVREGVARACMGEETERTEALRSFGDRMDGGMSTYLDYDGDRYGLWVRITDVVYSNTADPPADDADPCC